MNKNEYKINTINNLKVLKFQKMKNFKEIGFYFSQVFYQKEKNESIFRIPMVFKRSGNAIKISLEK